MTSYSQMTFGDLLKFNFVNLDQLTETYGMSFYGEYLTHWPEYQRIARHPTDLVVGYVLGKAEGSGEDNHGHISAVTVAPTFRRLGLGTAMVKFLEDVTEQIHRGYYVDLFARKSNQVAKQMYSKLSYIVYRTVTRYYLQPTEDALDMRKAMSRNAQRSVSAVIPQKEPITPDDLRFN